MRSYVAALEDDAMPEARFEWTPAHSGRIGTETQDGEAFSWQVAWHAGWHATTGGKEIPIARDALGLTMRIAHWLSGITGLILLLLAGRGILKKSW